MADGREKRHHHGVRALVANSGEGAVVVGADGGIVLINEAAEQLFGVHRHDAAGKSTSALGVPDLAREMDAVVREADAGPPRYLCFRKDGKFIECKVTPYKAPGEMGWVMTLRDDTELIRQQERAEAILASTGDGLVVFSPDNYVTFINPAACEMLGLVSSELLNTRRTMSELLRLESPDASEAVACWELKACESPSCPEWHAHDLRCWLVSGTICENQPATFQQKMAVCQECDVYLRNGRLLEESGISLIREVTVSEPVHRVLNVRTNPVIDSSGGYIGCVTSLHDVTAEREINQMKNEFVSTVSHELRTPLTSIKGYVDLILDGEAGEINEIQAEFLGIVKQNSDRLVSLINDLLDISRIESGRIHLTIAPIDMLDIVMGAVDTFKAVVDQQRIDLSMSVATDLPMAAGDRDRVGQVLINLLSNAIKYSPDGGKVRVTAKKRGKEIRVSVSDTGLGIPRDDLENVFSKFFRVDSSLTREIGGSGLGLSICKTIINLLGGDIWVESEVGKGSTFSFTLPCAPEQAKTPIEIPLDVAGAAKVGGDGGPTVLVVDRDEEVAKLIEIYLSKKGYRVVKAHSAHEAVLKAVEEKPRAITLDVMLGKEDGFDLLQQLKSNSMTSSIPVVVLSIVCDEGKSFRLGAAQYLEKPIEADRLVRVIDELVGSLESPLVLVVDDDKLFVDKLAKTLEDRVISVVKAYNGLQALECIAARRPDLILLDLRMPGIDGYEVIERVKRAEATKDIPIVVMTKYSLEDAKTDVLSMTSGALAKPFDVEELAQKVEALLANERTD